METILIPVEKEIKQWMKEAMKEYFEETKSFHSTAMEGLNNILRYHHFGGRRKCC